MSKKRQKKKEAAFETYLAWLNFLTHMSSLLSEHFLTTRSADIMSET